MSGPTIELRGNLGGNPDLRITPNGKTLCTLRVASTPSRKVAEGQYEDLETLWFTVTCWDSLAENVAHSLQKGDKVVVHGYLEQETWKREDGTSSVTLRVRATGLGADLGRAPVLVKRPVRAVAEPSAWTDEAAVVPEPPHEDALPDEQAA